MRARVIERDNYTVWFDQYEDQTFLHCKVYRYNKTVKFELINYLKFLLRLRKSPLYAIHERDDPKHLKFLTMLGFKYLETRICLDHLSRDIYVIGGTTDGN